MNKKLLLTLAGMSLVAGTLVFSGARANINPILEAKAANLQDFYIDVSAASSWWSNNEAVTKMQGWNGKDDVQTSGTWLSTTLFKVSVDTTNYTGIKAVRVCNDGTHDGTSWNTEFSTKNYFIHGGSGTNGEWTAKVPTFYDVTLSVTFASAVPEYADIYIPGNFNDWASDSRSKMTPNNDRTVFTFDAHAVEGTMNYKLVACYAGGDFSWDHQIDTTDKSIVIASSDADTTKVIRENVSYDFVSNMPQTVAPEGAQVQLTMSENVAAGINLYFVGGLTGWGTDSAKLASALMTPDANRKVFTWNIPSQTHTGSSEYKIVAMYANGEATQAAYDYTVYSGFSGNATITIDTSTLLYPLESSHDLKGLGAIAYAKDFVNATNVCDEDGIVNNITSELWTNQKNAYDNLPYDSIRETVRTAAGNASGTDLEKCAARYDYIVGKYTKDVYADFMNRNPAKPVAGAFDYVGNKAESKDAGLMIVTLGLGIVAAAGAFLVLRRKNQE